MGEYGLPEDFLQKFDAVRKAGEYSHICLFCGGGVNENGVGDHHPTCTRPGDREAWKDATASAYDVGYRVGLADNIAPSIPLLRRCERAERALLVLMGDKQRYNGTVSDEIREAWATVEEIRGRNRGKVS